MLSIIPEGIMIINNENLKIDYLNSEIYLILSLEKEIEDAFEVYDVEKKGYVNRVETRNIMGNFGFN